MSDRAMRMLLVTLLLICSLDQFARAGDPVPSPVTRDELRDCGKTYTCYVPTTCTLLDAGKLREMSKSTVTSVDSDTLVYPHCPAVVRVYSTVVDPMKLKSDPIPTPQCDPGKLMLSLDSADPTKKYEKIRYSPGNYFCDDEVYEIEYKNKSGLFSKISKIECKIDSNQFKFALTKINSDPLTKPDVVDEAEIRCVADVNLFCDEGVKVHEEKGKVNGPLYVKPVRAKNNKKAGTLKCADKTPHLVVKDIDKPIQNATFECTKFGKDQFWTVNRINMPPIRLTKDGPEVYCIDTLDCYLHLRIPESSVIGGDLDESTHLPKCGDKGILHVINGTKKARINPPYCNFATGEYEYNETMSNHIGVVVETTKFECTYPEETREEIRTPSVGKKVGASIGAFLGAIAVGAGIYGQKVWKRYCMDENEKELILKNIAKKETEEKTPKALLAGKEVYNWNRMLMHFQRRGFEQTGANRDGVFVPITRPDKHAQAQFDPKTKDPKIAADYYMNDRDVDENNTWDRTTVEKTLIDSIIIDLTECELSEEIEIRLDQREINECPVRVMEIRRRELPEL
ncbi:hypothetical protein PRIPAC_92545 [Pristionchus pacificus]|uniref:Uncharacterized protein n=1 Tax=Pristionchus pacificus TaxID=54126 RepID=A0A2A6CI59_PRIPA|nr:hypothetical protein PRIPAC_92545 [Pristionchus pacificus]|eukprot:PDM77905.1 hypothetical protein PRIPAC_34772 [Pristionchus pacificus]